MSEYDPRRIKRVVVYLTEEQYEGLWKLAFRRNCRDGIMNQVSVSRFLRELGSGKYRVVLQQSTNNVIRKS